MYELLAIQGIDGRKFVLALEHYSRLDRAEIFYNHAVVSGQLSLAARRSLLKDNSYEKIIDHSAYNPRQIEWITGLAGHHLNDDDNKHYVEFALKALDDPALVWRHGFENQLDDRQRALLFAFVSMPERVEQDQLATAFEGICAASGFETQGRAFRKALEVVDDSFVRCSPMSRWIFLTPYNPSVEDFLKSYLASTNSEARSAIRGAVYFEQVENLARMFRPRLPSEPDLVEDLASAMERCVDSDSCNWKLYSDEAGNLVITPEGVIREDRAQSLIRMMSWDGCFDREPHRSRLRSVFSGIMERIELRWSNGQGDRRATLRLLGVLRDGGENIEEVARNAKELVLRQLSHSQAFDDLIALRDGFPSVFTSEEWSELGEEFVRIATDELDDWREYDLRDPDRIDEIESYADRMGVELDQEKVETAREGILSEMHEIEESADHDYGPDDARTSEAGSAEEIRALFTGLADS
jgi:hypothetical protein